MIPTRIELISEQFQEVQCIVRSGSLTAMVTARNEDVGKVDSKCEIRVTKNGPYLVSGKLPIFEQIIVVNKEGVPVEWRLGKKYPLQEKCSLCRCGESKNKPFCDGAHTKIGFEGTEVVVGEPYLRQPKIVQGPMLGLIDFVPLCVSARFCERAGGIWKLILRSNDLDARRVAIEEAGDCPSGRLVVWDKKTGETLEPRLEKSIGLVEDPYRNSSGPIWVRGNVPIRSEDGMTYEVRNRVTLCRCGMSSNKPFCDASHFPEYR
jgi:CDGSH-type Zn-finger protein